MKFISYLVNIFVVITIFQGLFMETFLRKAVAQQASWYSDSYNLSATCLLNTVHRILFWRPTLVPLDCKRTWPPVPGCSKLDNKDMDFGKRYVIEQREKIGVSVIIFYHIHVKNTK